MDFGFELFMFGLKLKVSALEVLILLDADFLFRFILLSSGWNAGQLFRNVELEGAALSELEWCRHVGMQMIGQRVEVWNVD